MILQFLIYILIKIIKEIFGGLSIERTGLNKLINVTRVKSLCEIPKLEPFCNNLGHLSTIMDLDGVLCESSKNNTPHVNIEKLVALRRIAVNSDTITFDSSRMRTKRKSLPEDGNVVYYPFFNKESEEFLKYIIGRSNPNCRVDFIMGFLNKQINKGVEKRKQLVEENLKEGRKVVFIGSSRNDIRVALKTTENIDESLKKRVYVFNTGHWII